MVLKMQLIIFNDLEGYTQSELNIYLILYNLKLNMY